ncbi:glycoside hydrolase family 65 protein [Clostridium sp. YIM B02505]|uniref:Glycoside hydrolase family 65 protein n=1 Tax=Clostridium yunnanense TaxID=2800325 RepID=A0ABS1EQW0_9CLOT|nr:glycoside hydrolase family 65 protein [Clostridium yunnanense]MBK1811744.1 glycoside hydrolase family 65 protein [Clostridium yunnanense]
MSWTLKESDFNRENSITNGNKFIIGNGYMGYRGTLEEYTKEDLAACNLSGLYDQVEGKWRETVNAPNGLFTRLYCNGELLHAKSSEVLSHEQTLDIKNAVHGRKTVFKSSEDISVAVSSERFVSAEDLHMICMRYKFKVSKECEIIVQTGIDGDVWDINGPHLENYKCDASNGVIFMEASTHELNRKVAVAEVIKSDFRTQGIGFYDKQVFRSLKFCCEKDVEYTLEKVVCVYTENDVENPLKNAINSCAKFLYSTYEEKLKKHQQVWGDKWKRSDVKISGDNEGQFALRYSIYHLLIIAPTHTEKASIPARGLSGQVYKGAIFWDTEMFMLPFFIYTDPNTAKNLLMYRYHTLEGAKRKAKEYGYEGAFYAWESQDSGDDACTLFNVTDVFTNRPMRTYFRDKQIHISADVVYGLWQYYTITGDLSIILEGGAEVILECARFFYSYAYYKPQKQRYEMLSVTGPDEYHERVDNNVFTNTMVKFSLEVALKVLDILREEYKDDYEKLMFKMNFEKEINNIRDIYEKIYIPTPSEKSGIIEQFDGYEKLEELTLDELKSRIINKNEYLGGGNGLATTTKILKQADVVLMLNLFKERYPMDVKKKNWEYYEPRTEHGSSLSPCVYALLACHIGYSEWAYKYFSKTATIDLTGDSKQFVGNLYIGGTHPAANGGAWMSAVLGFAGVNFKNNSVLITPSLPQQWEEVSFYINVKNQGYFVTVMKDSAKVIADENNTETNAFYILDKTIIC